MMDSCAAELFKTNLMDHRYSYINIHIQLDGVLGIWECLANVTLLLKSQSSVF
jgi:hypothetical protein